MFIKLSSQYGNTEIEYLVFYNTIEGFYTTSTKNVDNTKRIPRTMEERKSIFSNPRRV
jgi:hypothetical protein